MTGPKEPGDDEDWGFPEVDPAGPTSTALPEPEEEGAHDTGSDAWWRAQAEAQRRAAASDPVVPPTVPAEPEPVPPPETVAPQVLTPVDPLDAQWLPPDLPELHAPPPAPEPPVEEPAQEPVEELPPPPVPPRAVARPPAVPLRATPPPTPADDTDPHGFPPVAAEPVAAEPVAAEPATRPPYEGEKVGPARALAGAAIALTGVLLGIGALFVLGDDEPKDGPVVAAPTTSTAPATPSPTATTTPEPTSSPTAAATTAPPVTSPPAVAPVVPVAVLNNSRVTGLASRAADRFRAGGWPVSTEGNYRGRLATTTVFYDTGQQASAERFARQFGIPRVLPRSAAPGLPVSGMTVVLTRDYRA